jgi:hypothetical protein
VARAPGGVTQHGDYALAAVGRDERTRDQQELGRDPFWLGLRRDEKMGRAGVTGVSFERRESAVNGLAHERVDERELTCWAQNVDPSQVGDCPRSCRLV